MADLFSMKSPLVIRFANGESRIMAEYFKHPQGLLFFDLFWHQQENSVHLVEGIHKGEGPWKVGEAVITVLGCHGCDVDLATQYADWQAYLQMHADEYPALEYIRQIARENGAIF